MTMKPETHYHSYLGLDQILDAQHLKSVEAQRPAHDEMLFIIVHQTYELWFKQILHELDSVIALYQQSTIAESDIGTALHRLDRISQILDLLISQVDVLETMTPLDFLEFRDLLYPASGFQSYQFRIFENRLGLKKEDRLLYNEQSYTSQLPSQHKQLVKQYENTPSLFDLVEAWLERTPFLELDGFDFWNEYKEAVNKMFDQDEEVVRTNRFLSESDIETNLKNIQRQRQTFESLFSEDEYKKLQQQGYVRLSHRALHAALLIHLYRDQPVLQQPFRVLTRLQDIDAQLTTWRYRHAIMAHRMLGRKIGTGGSSGHEYLAQATEKHRVFVDFNNLSTFFIPRSKLPRIPDAVKEKLGFYYAQ